MSDENRMAEYTRIYGVKKTLVHEKADAIALFKGALKRLSRNKRVVKREGDVPSLKGKTVTVTNAQYDAYKIITQYFTSSGKDTVRVKTLRDVGIRNATLKALEKQELIQISDEQASLWRRPDKSHTAFIKNGLQ
jgi:hypothetical protein